MARGVNRSLEVWGSRPPDFGLAGRGGGSQGGGRWGSWTGCEVILYLIMYRNYVQKLRLLKRTRIICE